MADAPERGGYGHVGHIDDLGVTCGLVDQLGGLDQDLLHGLPRDHRP
ncbi:hypothetical protein [Nonomuraea jabiensis]